MKMQSENGSNHLRIKVSLRESNAYQEHKHMQPDPRLDSILAWRYRRLADEALAYAQALKDPGRRRIFEELAAGYLKLATAKSPEPSGRSLAV